MEYRERLVPLHEEGLLTVNRDRVVFELNVSLTEVIIGGKVYNIITADESLN